ncbi:hypothetical protein U1Q18_034630 [Sarracenia purpurea var. burkii]
MNNPLSSHQITAAGQRDLQFLSNDDQIRVRHLIERLDLLVCHQTREHILRNVRKSVATHHLVNRRLHRIPSAVGADAGEGDLDRLVGGDGLVGGGCEGEVVGTEEGGEAVDAEEGCDVGERGGVGGDIADEAVADGSGAGRAVE